MNVQTTLWQWAKYVQSLQLIFFKKGLAFICLFLLLGLTAFTPSPNGNATGGSINGNALRLYGGLYAVLEDFDFDAHCNTISYTFTWVPRGDDLVVVENRGTDFSPAIRRALARVKIGDFVYFDNIKAKCPGDPVTRKLPTLAFKIK